MDAPNVPISVLTFLRSVLTGKLNVLTNYKGYTAVHVAAYFGLVQHLDQLLHKYPKLVNLESRSENSLSTTPLLLAVHGNQVSALKLLLKKGAWVNNRSSIGSHPNPLSAAVELQNFEIVKLLVNNGAEVDRPDEFGNTPLLIACRKKSIAIVKFLLANGACFRTKNMWGEMAFHSAVRHDEPAVLTLLIDSLKDKNELNNVWVVLRNQWQNEQHLSRWLNVIPFKDEILNYRCLLLTAVTARSPKCLQVLFPLIRDEIKYRKCGIIDNKPSYCLFHMFICYLPYPEEYETEILDYLLYNGVNPDCCHVTPVEMFNWFRMYSTLTGRVYQWSLWVSLKTLMLKLNLLYGTENVYYSEMDCLVVRNRLLCAMTLLQWGVNPIPPSNNIVHPLVIALLMTRQTFCSLLWVHCYQMTPNYLASNNNPVLLMAACLEPSEWLFKFIINGADFSLVPEYFWYLISDRKSGNDGDDDDKWLSMLIGSCTGESYNVKYDSEVEDIFNKELEIALKIKRIDCRQLLVIDNVAFFIRNGQKYVFGCGFTSLQHLCRVSLRHQLIKANNWVYDDTIIDDMTLPPKIKSYLKYGDSCRPINLN